MNESEGGKQNRVPVATGKEGLLQDIKGLADSFEKETEGTIKETKGTRTENNTTNRSFMAVMYSLLAERLKENTSGEGGYIYPADFANAIESILSDCQRHEEGVPTDQELPVEVTTQSRGQYIEFRLHAIQTAYTRHDIEFGDQVAEETLAIHEKLEEYNTGIQ